LKRFLHIVLVLVVAAACQGPRVIPKDTLTDIYTDMFLADQQVRELNIPHSQMDTMLLYEAVFEKYGYDTDDYLYSVQHYLKDPERFAKVFDAVAARLEGELDALQKIIEQEDEEARRLARRYPQVDSILAPFAKESCYAGQARMERDTALYAALYRLVAIQEDTLMVPVDSVEARARRDSLAAQSAQKVEAPADTALKAPKDLKDKLHPERPAIVLPRGREPVHPRMAREREIIATEVVEEEAVEEVRAE
jgi:hypothetical protein